MKKEEFMKAETIVKKLKKGEFAVIVTPDEKGWWVAVASKDDKGRVLRQSMTLTHKGLIELWGQAKKRAFKEFGLPFAWGKLTKDFMKKLGYKMKEGILLEKGKQIMALTIFETISLIKQIEISLGGSKKLTN